MSNKTKSLPIHSDAPVFSRSFLKMLAIFAMTLDHIALGFLLPNSILYQILRFIGRITIPIMTFFLVEGYLYTTNIKKYIFRLTVCAIVAQIPYSLFFDGVFFSFTPNFIFSLLLGMCAIVIKDSERIGTNVKFILLFSLVVIAFLCNSAFIAILLALCFYTYRNDNGKKWTLYFIISIEYSFLCIVLLPNEIYNFGLLIVPFLLVHYSELKEQTSKIMQYLFYVYYPLHLLFLWFIRFMINNS